MTGAELVVIRPLELKFTFEALKQSSCSVHLTNVTDEYVAFKVKTTSPKKYCVRPNIGIIKPKSTLDFTVIMQAQRTVPVDMQCKDKFLIQSTVVPFGKTEDEIMPEMFTKAEGKYIQENKLRVFLVSPPQTPVLQPVNGTPKEDSPDDSSTLKEKLPIGVENLPPPHKHIEKTEDTKIGTCKEEPRLSKTMEVAADLGHPKNELITDDVRSVTTEVTFSKNLDELKAKLGVESRSVEDMETTEVKISKNIEDVETAKPVFSKDIEELNERLGALNSKMIEAERTVLKLTQEKEAIVREKEILKQEVVLWRKKSGARRRVQVGFPPLFLCMVALVSIVVGFHLRA